jgi:CheY-like chemotaxis protein
MASGIAHDVNNALSPVIGFADLILNGNYGLDQNGKKYLKHVRTAGEDIAHIVARLREFYRTRDEKEALQQVSLSALAEQVVEMTRPRWRDIPQSNGITIELQTDFAAGAPRLAGIESEIREALINLVFNAIDAMPEGGTLTIRTKVNMSSAQTRYVDVEVSDTGVGMSEETRRRCLEPFFTTKGERGTGLGLAMVYGVARRHNAEIDMESVIDQGTTVRLRFPVPAANAAEIQVPPQAMPPRLRILSVDDDPLLIKALRDALEADGHAVVTANGGQEGIDAFRAAEKRDEHFAVVITYLGMPYVDGRKVASAIKTDSPSTPVILLTGWGQRLIAEGDIPPHVDRVLNKPPKLRELRAALADLAGSAPPADNNVRR